MRRTSRSRVHSKPRPLTLIVDRLEVRQLLTAVPTGPVAHPMFAVFGSFAGSVPPTSAYTPTQIQQAYGFNNIKFGTVQGNGAGETIAIVDAYSDPNIQSDLNTFDAQFGLPNTTLNIVDQNGGTSYPATDSSGGWEMEMSLDVEWAHAMAPDAKITVVEANSGGLSDLLAGVSYASTVANVVSMSWGGGEFSGQTQYDGTFSQPGVAFVASSGDAGAPVSWPASSPNVLAVGGTTLSVGVNGAYAGETGWSGSGGGPSAYESQPSYQAGVVNQTNMRANPDVAYNADPSTGYAVYDSFTGGGGWLQVGGTSAGAPQWSALLAIADQGRALSGQAPLNSTNPQEVLTTLYQNATTGDFHDVTSGTSTGTPNYTAGPGYDYVTGLGSPVANKVVQSLVGASAPAPAPVASDTLALSAPTSDTAGSAFSLTVTALNSGGGTDAGYLGTIAFSSSDVQAGLPSSYTFTAADAGSHTFSVVLKTAGSQSISATDTANSATKGTVSGLAVSPAAASQFVLSGLAQSVTAGNPHTLTVTAMDPYGNVATGFTGTVQFASSDAQALLPAAYTFTAADAGSRGFGLTFETSGTQSVTATSGGISATQSGISVSPAAPISLAASAASDSQINLTWTASAGDAGYAIDRSADGGNTWTQVATTSAGVTSYHDTGLAAGTTYQYSVQATGGGLASAFSNVAAATTLAAPSSPTTGATDTLWSNSYTPPENAYAAGTYDVGVQFSSSVAGTVTGVRFYKQTWMGGYAHVGYLWSTSGTLLASASFNNETSYGWQQVSFSKPVAIAANTDYIVSFSTGGGYFGITTGYFSGSGAASGPLQAPADGLVPGGNGVYGYGDNAFPNTDGSGMNFWADVAFSPSASPAVTTASTSTTSGVAPAPATAVGHSGHRRAASATGYVVPAGPRANSSTVAVAPAQGRVNRPLFSWS